MKNFSLLFALFLALPGLAQSSFYSVYKDNSTIDQTHLHVLPWDETKLIQTYEILDTISWTPYYFMEFGLNGLPFGLPGCGVITAKPEFLEEGILAAGTSFSEGVELHYYNGTIDTTFNINSNGDSDPYIMRIDENKVYLSAITGNGVRNAFVFDESSLTLTQRSFETQSNDMRVLIEVNDEVYVSNEIYDYQANIVTFELLKYDTLGVKTVIKNASAPIGVGEKWMWYNPIYKWGELFIVESYLLTNSGPHQIRILPIISSNEYNSLDYYLPNSGGAAFAQMFDDDQKLYAYLNGTDSLFSIEEHISGSPTQSFQLQHQFSEGVLAEHHVSENNQLYFRVIENPSSLNKIVRLNGNLENLLLADDHIHFILESDEVIYVNRYDKSWIGTDEPSAVYLINSAYDVVDKVEIELGLHGPFIEAAVMFENKYTFFFIEYNGSVDIIQLDSSPLLSLQEIDDVNVYPNPINNGQVLLVNSRADTYYEIWSLDGRAISKGDFIAGKNYVETTSLPGGTYLLRTETLNTKFIVSPWLSFFGNYSQGRGSLVNHVHFTSQNILLNTGLTR